MHVLLFFSFLILLDLKECTTQTHKRISNQPNGLKLTVLRLYRTVISPSCLCRSVGSWSCSSSEHYSLRPPQRLEMNSWSHFPTHSFDKNTSPVHISNRCFLLAKAYGLCAFESEKFDHHLLSFMFICDAWELGILFSGGKSSLAIAAIAREIGPAPRKRLGRQGVEGQGDSRGESSLHMFEFSFVCLVRETFVLPRHLPCSFRTWSERREFDIIMLRYKYTGMIL